jgi:N-methylhydantoinase B
MNTLDSITVEVMRNYLLSAAREMTRNLIRTSYSTIVYEIHDFGLGIYDRQCRMLAEAPGLAIFTRANDYALRKIVEFLGEDNIHPGDVILLNYPYWSSTHTLDVTAASPIFCHDQLVGFTAVKQHWLDLKQKDPGYCLDTTDMHQEGLFFPCSKIYQRGVLNKGLEDLIRFNCRMPDRVIGDMNAQISSCRTGERRVKELVEKFGLDTFEAAVEQILDHGERIARARLATLPKGTWSAEDWVDDDGIDRDSKVKIKATVTITAEEMVVDFSGSSPATKGPINIPFGCTMGVAALVFKAITTPDTPANEGNLRPLRVEAPAGTLMHAVPPAATFTLWPALLATEVITKALAQGMPDIVPACSGGDVCSMMGVGTNPRNGRMWLEATNEGVGFGGHAGGDGENGIMHITEPGCHNNPIEVLETKAPLRIEGYGLRQDSAGPGEHRGGLGITRAYRFLAESSALTLVKKTKTKPWGMTGGSAGENCHVILRPGTDRQQVTGMVYESMAPGEVLVNCSGGGGGWGNPFKRDPKKVLEDVRNEYVSLASAREDYGVVIDPQTLTLDTGATATLRQERLRDWQAVVTKVPGH